MGKYFGTDGIRGPISQKLNHNIAVKCGQALAEYRPKPKVILAKDTRPSGNILASGLTLGIISGGGSVVDIGVCPTAGVAFITKVLEADYGVVITASHNSPEYNGIKIFNSEGEKLGEAEEREIESIMDRPMELNYYSKGSVVISNELVDVYTEYLENINIEDFSGIKVVLDTANGASVEVAKRVFSDLGACVVTVGASLDGLYINECCGALHPELLIQQVREENADIGFAFDGDADRVIAVTNSGEVLDGDRILLILAKYLKEHNRLNSNTIVVTQQTNQGIVNTLEKLGIHAIRTKVGDKFVIEKIDEQNLSLGGEKSGHIIIKEFSNTADGILTAVILTGILKSTKKDLSNLAKVDLVPSIEIDCVTSFASKIINFIELKELVQTIESSLVGSGRVVVRKSGTEPIIRILVEAQSEQICRGLAEQIAKVVFKLHDELADKN